MGLDIISIPEWTEIYLQFIPTEFIDQDYINALLYKTRIQDTQRIKRTGDIFFSIILLILTSPLFLYFRLYLAKRQRRSLYSQLVREFLMMFLIFLNPYNEKLEVNVRSGLLTTIIG